MKLLRNQNAVMASSFATKNVSEANLKNSSTHTDRTIFNNCVAEGGKSAILRNAKMQGRIRCRAVLCVLAMILFVFFTACDDGNYFIKVDYQDFAIEPPQPPEGEIYYVIGYVIKAMDGKKILGVDTANGIGKADAYLLAPKYLKEPLFDAMFMHYHTPYWTTNCDIYSVAVKDVLFTKNLPDTLFAFSSDRVRPSVQHHYGIWIFPAEYRWEYKVRMTYDVATDEDEMINSVSISGFGSILFPLFFPWNLEQIIHIKSISREEN
jgi:hypothetical protein